MEFRRSEKGPWIKVDPDNGADMADLFADVFADFGGAIVEGVATSVLEFGVLAASAKAAFLGPLAAKTVFLGGTGLAAAGGSLARGGVIDAVDALIGDQQRDAAIDDMSESMWAGGINLVTMGLGTTLGGVKNFFVRKFSGASPRTRLRAIKTAMEDMENSLRSLLPDNTPVGLDKAAKRAHGALDGLEEQYGKAVGLVKDAAADATQGQTFVPENAIKIGAERLKNSFGREGPDGLIRFGKDVLDPGATVAEVSEAKLKGEFSSIVARRRLANAYNNIIENKATRGGIGVEEMEAMITDLGGLSSEFAASGNKAIRGVGADAAAMRNALRTDAFGIYNKLFPGESFEGKAVKEIFDNYAENIGTIALNKKAFRGVDRASKAAKLFGPRTGERVKLLKAAMGSESQEFRGVAGEWTLDLMKKSTDATTGIMNPDKFLNTIKNLDAGTKAAMMDPEQWGALIHMAQIIKKTDISDLVKKEPGQRAVKDFLAAFVAEKMYPQTRAAMVMRYFGGSVDVMDFMDAKGGIIEAAVKTNSKAKASALMTLLKDLRQIASNSRIATIDGERVYVPIARRALTQPAIEARRAAFNSGNVDAELGIESVPPDAASGIESNPDFPGFQGQ